MEEPNWERIEQLRPVEAWMDGYMQGREDSKKITDNIRGKLDEIIPKI